MTVILVAVGMFTAGLVMVFWFRRVVSAEDELERRWADAMRQRAIREAEAEPPADQEARLDSEEAPASDARPPARE